MRVHVGQVQLEKREAWSRAATAASGGTQPAPPCNVTQSNCVMLETSMILENHNIAFSAVDIVMPIFIWHHEQHHRHPDTWGMYICGVLMTYVYVSAHTAHVPCAKGVAPCITLCQSMRPNARVYDNCYDHNSKKLEFPCRILAN